MQTRLKPLRVYPVALTREQVTHLLNLLHDDIVVQSLGLEPPEPVVQVNLHGRGPNLTLEVTPEQKARYRFLSMVSRRLDREIIRKLEKITEAEK